MYFPLIFFSHETTSSVLHTSNSCNNIFSQLHIRYNQHFLQRNISHHFIPKYIPGTIIAAVNELLLQNKYPY